MSLGLTSSNRQVSLTTKERSAFSLCLWGALLLYELLTLKGCRNVGRMQKETHIFNPSPHMLMGSVTDTQDVSKNGCWGNPELLCVSLVYNWYITKYMYIKYNVYCVCMCVCLFVRVRMCVFAPRHPDRHARTHTHYTCIYFRCPRSSTVVNTTRTPAFLNLILWYFGTFWHARTNCNTDWRKFVLINSHILVTCDQTKKEGCTLRKKEIYSVKANSCRQ